MLPFTILHPKATLDHLGLIPHFFNAADPATASEQIHTAYSHGGGWSPFGAGKWTLTPDGKLKYPGDRALAPLARAKLRDETITIYEHALVSISQPDGTFAVSRLD